jgi:hypothetical protein
LKSECPHIRQLLSGYIDGVLDTPQMTAIREHLQSCRDCSHEHDTLKSLIRELGNIGSIKTPDNFLEKVYEGIRDDSFFDRIREILSFRPSRLPFELAAFATTAVLIIFLFNFFPAEEKVIIQKSGHNNAQSVLNQGTLQTQTAGNANSAGQPVESPVTQRQVERVPVNLALALTTVRETTPIPSQNVSFGNSETGYTSDDLNIWPPENDSTKEILQPDEVNSKIDEIVSSVDGNLLSRANDPVTGYPTHLTLDILVTDYRRFISKLETLGALQAQAPALPEGAKDVRVLIQMELSRTE